MPKSGVASAGIVETLNVLEDRCPHYLLSRPVAPVEKLRLQGDDKRLSESVVAC
jgi:hypothetical protein